MCITPCANYLIQKFFEPTTKNYLSPMKATTRKSFITKSALTLGALFAPRFLIAKPNAPLIAIADLSKIHTSYSIDENIIFMNNATMGPSPKPVVAALIEGLEDVTKRTLFGRKQSETIDTLATFVNASKSEIALTHNATEGINIALWGVNLKSGDEIIICSDEHAGNASAWLHRAKLNNLVVKGLQLGKTANETLNNLKKITTIKTKIFALPHISCALGQILPIAEISKYAKSKKITTCIDGAQALGMIPINLQELDVDYYATCCHKWLQAPQGTGFLYINKRVSANTKPIYFGAEGTLNFKSNISKPTLSEEQIGAKRFMNGTKSGALLNGVIAACQFQNGLGKANIENRIRTINNYLYSQLALFTKHISILSPSESKSRCGIVCFKFMHHDNSKFRNFAEANGVIVRYVAENELNAIRVSTSIYNSQAQVDSFINLIKKFID
jgi:cysteine desulfurase / selenocysteine lyase